MLSVFLCVVLQARTENIEASTAASSIFQTPADQTAGPAKPRPPRVLLDAAVVASSGRTTRVGSASNLQQALDGARPGDVIELESGASFTGNFTLSNKDEKDQAPSRVSPANNAGAGIGARPSSSNWITIRSSAPDKIAAGDTRVSPKAAGLMAKLVTANGDSVLRVKPAAHHYRFIGVEFTMAPSVKSVGNLIKLGEGSETDPAALPHDIIFDRCYIHGSASQTLRRGIALNSASTSIINSYISDVHEAGADSQAICGWNGPGPFKIVNNYLEAAGENVMFGGADPSIKGLVSSDIEFKKNHCFKPLSWKKGDPGYGGAAWSIKNLFELKNAQRVVIDGNIFENNWVDAQTGYAILLKCQNQDGGAEWSVTQDVSFTNNIVRHASSAMNLLGRDPYHPSGRMQRISIRNNLFDDIGGAAWGGEGVFLKITDCIDTTIDHNTIHQTGNIITAYGEPSTRVRFSSNIVQHNQYGIKGDGAASGEGTLSKYFPGGVFQHNALIGAPRAQYPRDNLFIDASQGRAGDYKSDNAADVGCDLKALQAAGISASEAEQAMRKGTR